MTNPTPEELLGRAVAAIGQAEKDAENGYEWTQIALAATDAGQLALDIRQAEPRTVVIDDISQVWRSGIEAYTTPHPFASKHEMMVTKEEAQTIRALRNGKVTVQPVARARQNDADARYPRRGGSVYPRDPDQSDVDADRMEDMRAQERTIIELRRFLTTMLLRQALTATLLRQGVVSDYLSGDDLAKARGWEIEINQDPADGAVTMLVRRDAS